jgi:hypothetical protein
MIAMKKSEIGYHRPPRILVLLLPSQQFLLALVANRSSRGLGWLGGAGAPTMAPSDGMGAGLGWAGRSQGLDRPHHQGSHEGGASVVAHGRAMEGAQGRGA